MHHRIEELPHYIVAKDEQEEAMGDNESYTKSIKAASSYDELVLQKKRLRARVARIKKVASEEWKWWAQDE